MKKGFTLVELLAVIVIISLLTFITVTTVTNITNSGKGKLNKSQQDLIMKSAQLWGADNLGILPENGECAYITLTNLIDEGYIDKDVYDIESNEKLDLDEIIIRIDASINSSGKLKYNYIINPNNVDGCDYVYDDV